MSARSSGSASLRRRRFATSDSIQTIGTSRAAAARQPLRGPRRPQHRRARTPVGVPSAEDDTSPRRARRRHPFSTPAHRGVPRRMLEVPVGVEIWRTLSGSPRSTTNGIRRRVVTESSPGGRIRILHSTTNRHTNPVVMKITTLSRRAQSVVVTTPAADTVTYQRTQSRTSRGSIRTDSIRIRTLCHITSVRHHHPHSSSTLPTATLPRVLQGCRHPCTHHSQAVRYQDLLSADVAISAWHHHRHAERRSVTSTPFPQGATRPRHQAVRLMSPCVSHHSRHPQPQHTFLLQQPQRPITRATLSRPRPSAQLVPSPRPRRATHKHAASRP
jgi:hypothetical protein